MASKDGDHRISKQEQARLVDSDDEEVDDFMLTVHPVENDVSESQSGHDLSGQVKSTKRKAGRPPLVTSSDKTECPRSWNDSETSVLIELWSNHENLYNTKLQNYFNRELRQKSLLTIRKGLLENDINASIKQISKKLTDLKNYYGGQLRKIRKFENSSNSSSDEGFVSFWKFFEKLNFLNDAFTPRKTPRVFEEEEEEGDVYERHPPPSSSKTTKLMVITPQDQPRRVPRDEPVTESVFLATKTADSGADDIFGQLLISQMQMIPECDLKDDLKITLQQMILRCKRQVNAIRHGHEPKEHFSGMPSMAFSISSPNDSTSSSYSEHQ